MKLGILNEDLLSDTPVTNGLPAPSRDATTLHLRILMTRKRRTRQHIIADLSVNHIERFVLLNGYSTERVNCDYGIDLIIFTYDANGEIENGQIFVQLLVTSRKFYNSYRE